MELKCLFKHDWAIHQQYVPPYVHPNKMVEIYKIFTFLFGLVSAIATFGACFALLSASLNARPIDNIWPWIPTFLGASLIGFWLFTIPFKEAWDWGPSSATRGASPTRAGAPGPRRGRPRPRRGSGRSPGGSGRSAT